MKEKEARERERKRREGKRNLSVLASRSKRRSTFCITNCTAV